jgi:recombination protein RecT
MTKQTDSPEAKPETMRLYVERHLPDRIAQILPAHLKPDRFMRVAYAALVRTPKLQECTKLSVIDCLVRLSQVGLEPDGRMAHLIPFKDTKSGTMVATLVIDYKGLVDIVRRSGEVSLVEGRAVHKGDEFKFSFGSNQYLRHVPTFDDEPGPVVAAYSFVRFKDGGESFHVMSKREIDAIRARSKSPDKGPWVTDYEAMAAKTAFRPHSKWLPFSPELREKIWADDDAPIDIQTETVEQPRLKNAGSDDFAGTSFSEPEPESAKEPEPLFS